MEDARFRLKIRHACAGKTKTSVTMGWSDLPIEMVEIILVSLTLIELARASRTCRTFQAVFSMKMAGEQKAYGELALKRFNFNRISCIAGRLDCLLKGETIYHGLAFEFPDLKCISADGTLCDWYGADYNVGDVEMVTYRVGTFKFVDVGLPCVRCVGFRVDLLGKAVLICIRPSANDDLEGVALVHALMTGRWVPHLRGCGLSIHIRIEGYKRERCTSAGLHAQIAPLRPLASRSMLLSTVPEGWPLRKGQCIMEKEITVSVGDV
jgi:hypothetical protein